RQPEWKINLQQPRLEKTSDILLAGISIVSRRLSPEDSPKRSRSAVSRRPHDGSRAFRDASKAAFEGALWAPLRMNGPYRKRSPPGRSKRPAPANNPKVADHGAI